MLLFLLFYWNIIIFIRVKIQFFEHFNKILITRTFN